MVWVVGIGFGLVLLFAFPKQMGVLLLLLALGATGFFGFYYIQGQREAAEYRKRVEAVKITASYGRGCEAAFPILVVISNHYSETIQSLTFELGGYREGFSSPVYQGLSYKSDKIIAPGETYTSCWTQPGLYYGAQETAPGDLIWRATYSYATFGDTP